MPPVQDLRRAARGCDIGERFDCSRLLASPAKRIVVAGRYDLIDESPYFAWPLETTRERLGEAGALFGKRLNALYRER